MSSILLSIVLLAALQLNPALTPQKSPKPALPKIDENACPFEGCQFGQWTAAEPVRLYSTWKSDRKLLRGVAKGERVEALTGIHITFEPAEIRVTAPMPQYGLKPGDTVFGYMNLGEGFFSAWFNGYWVEEFDGSGVQSPDGSGCRRNCTATLLKAARSEWWVKLKTRDGRMGWTKDADKFEGSDALAASAQDQDPALPEFSAYVLINDPKGAKHLIARLYVGQDGERLDAYFDPPQQTPRFSVWIIHGKTGWTMSPGEDRGRYSDVIGPYLNSLTFLAFRPTSEDYCKDYTQYWKSFEQDNAADGTPDEETPEMKVACKRLPDESVNGRHAQVWEIRPADTQNEDESITSWFDPKLRFNIRQVQGPVGGLQLELHSIQEGPQPPALFQLENQPPAPRPSPRPSPRS